MRPPCPSPFDLAFRTPAPRRSGRGRATLLAAGPLPAGLLSACVLSACLMAGCAPRPPAPADEGAATAMARILALEDERRDDDGTLRELLRSGAPEVRARAALALGRFEVEDLGAPATDALVGALRDPDPRVREMAAFGIGLREDAAASLAIVAHLGDPDAEVRSALVEAATRLTDRTLVPHVLRALEDPDARVRAAAADGVQRWPWVDRATAPEGDRVLAREIDGAVAARVLAGATSDIESLDGRVEPEEYEVVWRGLAALARRGAPRALGAFLRFGVPVRAADAGHDGGIATVEARLFAAQGLARLAGLDALAGEAEVPGAEADVRRALEALAADVDLRVAVEAVRGLGALARRGAHSDATVTVLGAALGHPSTHVRVVAWESLGAFSDRAAAAHLAARIADEDAPPARAAALVALARLAVSEAREHVARASASPDLVVRKGAATAAAELESAVAEPLLLALADDAHPKVSGEALAGLARHSSDAARAKLRAALTAGDSGVRLAAATALREIATPLDVPQLQVAALTSTGDAGPEARFEAARTLARIDDPAARRTLVQLAREDADPFVRRVAGGLLASLGETPPPAAPERGAQQGTGTPAPAPPLAPPDGPNPWVAFATTRGELVFELLPRDAPHHVENLLQLVRRGAYDGTSWHRVVPDFVVQGGDPRGDGNGGGTWRGPDDALRLEVTRRRYVTGSLGMPRNEDRDSGGRQIFVTHRPTPHLDGRYTIFGELRSGFEALQALVEGDLIVSARVLER